MTIIKFPTPPKAIDAFVQAMQDDKFDHVLVIMRANGEDYYMPLTDTDTGTFGWMATKTAHALMHEEMDEWEEEEE